MVKCLKTIRNYSVLNAYLGETAYVPHLISDRPSSRRSQTICLLFLILPTWSHIKFIRNLVVWTANQLLRSRGAPLLSLTLCHIRQLSFVHTLLLLSLHDYISKFDGTKSSEQLHVEVFQGLIGCYLGSEVFEFNWFKWA